MSKPNKIKRSGRILGGYVPNAIFEAVTQWVKGSPERDQSMFIREAVREKLRRDGIEFKEKV